ncbi:MAG: pyridoxal-phosphate dependent enzyme [Bacteroidota bacterium]
MDLPNIPNQEVKLPELEEKQVRLFVKREDKIHPLLSGNKYRKLKYNLQMAKSEGHHTLLTFGGAFSNHIVATAYAGKDSGFKTIGVIRGEEWNNTWKENPSLSLANRYGMKFYCISRARFQQKKDSQFLKELKKRFGSFYLIPEGGTNSLAVKGCEEILTQTDLHFDYICTCVGSGGTIAGLINSSTIHQTVLGFPALKGNFLREDIYTFVKKDNWNLISDYHFGGYAKVNKSLIQFINEFRQKTQIPLEPIYTGKMMFGIMDRIKKGFFKPSSQILAIHSGGLQGIKGMNSLLRRKNLPELDV